MKTLTVYRNVRHAGRVIVPGQYVMGEETAGNVLSEEDAKAVLTYPTWAAMDAEATGSDQDADDSEVEFDLSADDAAIKAVLEPLTAEQRNEIWASLDADAMADFLVERADRERKDWKVQTMGNMIEKHVGL